jgi:hypothetical protein
MVGMIVAVGSIGLSILLCRTLNHVVLSALLNTYKR